MTWQVGEKVTVVESGKDTISSELGVGVKQLGELSSKIVATSEVSYKTSLTSEFMDIRTTEDVFRLPVEPPDPNTLHVKARRIEVAPTYQRLRVILRKDCPRCRQSSIVPIIVRVRLDDVAVRHMDVWEQRRQA